MTKIISFLGTGKYHETVYQYGEQLHTTKFIQEALKKFIDHSSFMVALTPTVAAGSNWQELSELDDSYHVLEISESQTPEAHMEILTAITESVNDTDDLILDITHSFRSIPMVALTAAFYLKASNKVNSLRIFYGAFEHGSQAPTPIHELTGLLEIMQWVNAAQVFQRFGDGSDFAELLKAQHSQAWRNKSLTPAEKPRTLQNYAQKLIEASDALSANQPHAIKEAATHLQSLKEQAQTDIQDWAKPFAMVFDDVHQQLSDFADLDLVTQKRLLHWYADRGRLVETAQLAREWVVTYTALHLGVMPSLSDIADKNIRLKAEGALGQCYDKDYNGSDPTLSELSEQLRKSSLYTKIMDAWNFLGTRNTLSHCGFNAEVQPVPTLKKKIKEWVAAIDALPNL